MDNIQELGALAQELGAAQAVVKFAGECKSAAVKEHLLKQLAPVHVALLDALEAYSDANGNQ